MTELAHSPTPGPPASHAGHARSDVLFTFSYETWTDARQRGMMRPPDRILATLLASPEVRRLLVANPWRSAPTALARRLLQRDAHFPSDDARRLTSPLRVRRNDPIDSRAIARSYGGYSSALRRAAIGWLADPAVLTTNPLAAGFGEFGWAGPVTYFGRDDWSSSPAREEYWPAYRAAYRRIAESGMGVTAVSQQIIDRIEPSGPHAVVPNGVEPAEWLGERPPPPAWFAAIPGPRAVYVGTLDTRLDVDGIAALAAARPDLGIVLLGPVPSASYVDELTRWPNVHIHPGVGRAELAATLRSAELALVAHRRTPLTEAMSPLKVYEYLAAGSPVISIDLPPVRALGDRVILVDAVADFADVVDRALALGPADELDRQRFIAANSWSARHASVMAIAFRGANVSSG
jgi:glycosyltransferase involved in cell wall biosynthesis